jgi:hypothetical protein
MSVWVSSSLKKSSVLTLREAGHLKRSREERLEAVYDQVWLGDEKRVLAKLKARSKIRMKVDKKTAMLFKPEELDFLE